MQTISKDKPVHASEAQTRSGFGGGGIGLGSGAGGIGSGFGVGGMGPGCGGTGYGPGRGGCGGPGSGTGDGGRGSGPGCGGQGSGAGAGGFGSGPGCGGSGSGTGDGGAGSGAGCGGIGSGMGAGGTGSGPGCGGCGTIGSIGSIGRVMAHLPRAAYPLIVSHNRAAAALAQGRAPLGRVARKAAAGRPGGRYDRAMPEATQPARPKDLTEQELGFARQDAVRWLSPGVLVGTGIRALLASIFGSYADKRELQAVLPPKVHDHAQGEELWLDFTADVGDGFDPTYSIASLLAAPGIAVTDGGERKELPRGQLLVLGGDQIYPAASARGYEDRTKGPYRAALPVAPDPAPVMFALPGNHDWYDGLTAFLRVFTQARPIGGWATEQSRSYFAIQLPQRWWLYAVDAQLSSYIDSPQLEYFSAAAQQLRPGDAVILCWPTPVWVETARNPEAYDPIEFFEGEIIAPRGATIRAMLSGDAHHYVRYADDQGTGTRITCGTGGAYLVATHRLPEKLEVPSPKSRMRRRTDPRHYTLRTRYPDRKESAALAPGILRLGWRNPGFWTFMGILQTLFVISLVFAVDYGRRTGGSVGSLETLRASFPCVVLAGLYVYGAYLFAKLDRGSPRRTAVVAGLLHGLAQLGLGAGWTFAVFALHRFRPDWLPDILLALVVVALTFVLVGFAATLLTGVYLLLASLVDVNLNEVMAGQSIEDYKGFLRLHIDTDASLRIYPVKLRKVCHRWQADPGGAAADPWLKPAGDPLAPELIEPSIRIPREEPL